MKFATITILAALIAGGTLMALAQGKPPGGGESDKPGGGERGHRPPPPIFEALDLNHDGIISADEIAKASESLKKLDKNGDGQLTRDELRPPRPEGGHGKGDGKKPSEGGAEKPPPPPRP
jgi:hypothetical protein